MKKYHIIYRTTNSLTGRYYIGKHSTNNINDNYLGSGKALKLAIAKYGKHNFIKEILFIYDTEKEAFEKESELVNEEFINLVDTYNITLGGSGNSDFSFTDEEGNFYKHTSNSKATLEKTVKTNIKKYGVPYFLMTKECRHKNIAAMQEKYGVDYTLQVFENREKSLQAMEDKLGTRFPIQIKEIHEKFKQSMIDKYGVDCWLKNKDNYIEYQETLITRYGVDHPMKVPAFAKKSKENREATMMLKYGHKHYMSSEEGREKARKSAEKRKENGFIPANLDKIVITNGVTNKFINKDTIIPEGWVKGKTGKDTSGKNSSNFGTFWINDGVKNIKHPSSLPIPLTFVKGMLIKKNN